MTNVMLWEIICIALMIWCAYSAVRLSVKVIRTRRMLHTLRTNGDSVVHGFSTRYQAGAYLAVMALELFGLIFFARYFFPPYRLNGLLAAVIGGLCASTFVTLVIHSIALFQEKHVYLTKLGLITYVDCHRFSDCRFAWESTEAALADMLHVYIKKDPNPFTVRFDGDPAPAHALTEQYAAGEAAK